MKLHLSNKNKTTTTTTTTTIIIPTTSMGARHNEPKLPDRSGVHPNYPRSQH
jgi:hypothetical protein